MEIKLTADWILQWMGQDADVNEDNKVIIYCDTLVECYFIRLALDTMKVKYAEGNSEGYVGTYIFNIEDIKEPCPEKYERLNKYCRRYKNLKK